MNTKLRTIKIISRTALGLVWFYEGLVPKILFLRADEVGLVQASNLVWRGTALALRILGVTPMPAGRWPVMAVAARTGGLSGTSWMLVLARLVGTGNPSTLGDPFGARREG